MMKRKRREKGIFFLKKEKKEKDLASGMEQKDGKEKDIKKKKGRVQYNYDIKKNTSTFFLSFFFLYLHPTIHIIIAINSQRPRRL